MEYANFGAIKTKAEYFKVTEFIDFKLTNEGEHLWLYVEKINLNTQDIIKKLSEITGISRRNIGYSGLKDKLAVTKQWFSIYDPKKTCPIEKILAVELQNIKILKYSFHNKKLKVGSHKLNQFNITVTDICGSLNKEKLKKINSYIVNNGILNLFGIQRFGKDNKNLSKAIAWITGEIFIRDLKEKNFLISVLRSYIFNVFAKKTINHKIEISDIVGFTNSNCYFKISEDDIKDSEKKLKNNELVLAGVLVGKNPTKPELSANLKEVLNNILSEITWHDDLIAIADKSSFRATRIFPIDFKIQKNEEKNIILLGFSLPKGCYATTVIEEISRFIANENL